jgi:acyl-CoA thioester hydrolase
LTLLADTEAPSAGFFRGKTHVLPVRVYYEDTDFTGVVYHASFLRFMERGRTDCLRMLGVSHASMWADEEPLAFAIRRMEIDFLKPARIDDALLVETRFLTLSGASLHAQQAIRRADESLIEARLQAVLVGANGRPKRPPAALRALIEAAMSREA